VADVVREGLAIEQRDSSIKSDEIASKIGIGGQGYSKLRRIVMLFDRIGEFKEADQALIRHAYEQMNATGGKVDEPFRLIEVISSRLWGTKRGKISNERVERKRIEHAETVISVCAEQCTRVSEMTLPQFDRTKIKTLKEEIDHAIASLRKLSARLSEVHA
jgi:hypothetical protein